MPADAYDDYQRRWHKQRDCGVVLRSQLLYPASHHRPGLTDILHVVLCRVIHSVARLYENQTITLGNGKPSRNTAVTDYKPANRILDP